MLTFNEDTRVKIPATIQLLRLGYNYQSLKADDIDIDFHPTNFIIRYNKRDKYVQTLLGK